MRYFRSVVFDVGLVLLLIGVLAALWTTKDIIAMVLQFFYERDRIRARAPGGNDRTRDRGCRRGSRQA